MQLNYNSVPRNLYDELKMYIEDLLNEKRMVHSSSSYSCPVVVIRKKMGPSEFVVTADNLMPKQYLIDIRSLISKISLIILVEISILHF